MPEQRLKQTLEQPQEASKAKFWQWHRSTLGQRASTEWYGAQVSLRRARFSDCACL